MILINWVSYILFLIVITFYVVLYFCVILFLSTNSFSLLSPSITNGNNYICIFQNFIYTYNHIQTYKHIGISLVILKHNLIFLHFSLSSSPIHIVCIYINICKYLNINVIYLYYIFVIISKML